MEFQATCKKTGERLFISAPDYHAAAKKAANLLNHTRGLTAFRETGTPAWAAVSRVTPLETQCLLSDFCSTWQRSRTNKT